MAILVLTFTPLSQSFAQAAEPHCSEANTQTGSQSQIEPRKEIVVVTGTFVPTPLQDLDRSVDVIEAVSPWLYGHWVDYLDLEPSIDLRQRAPNGVQSDLSIRGSTFGQTLVLINGLRMNDVQTGHHSMDLPLPAAALDRIEVLRGAGSTFYGSDAVGGAVNFITARPEYSEVRVGAGVGNFGINQQSASVALLHGAWDQELSAARDFSSGFRPDRDYRSFTAFSNTGLSTGPGRTLVMLGFADKPFGADQFYGNFNSWERTKSWFAGLKQDLGARTEFDLAYRRHSDVFVLFRDQPSVFENNHISQSWQTALRRKQPLSQNATFLYGGEGFHDSIESNNLGRHARSRGAAYGDFDVRALGRFSFSAGVREEIYDTGDGQFSPTVSAGVWLRAGLKLKGSVSRAFRLPTFTDLYYHDPANLGNPDLKPETAWDYEAGLQWDNGGRYRAELTLFHRREKNDIDYIRSSPTDIWQAANIQRLNFTGVETSLEMRLPRRQRVDFAYTGLHGAQEELNSLQSKYVFNYPTHNASVTWLGMLPGNLLARSRLGVTSRYARDPYALWDASIGREFSHFQAHVGFYNLTDTQYEEILGVAMPGRSVVFGVDLFVRGKQANH